MSETIVFYVPKSMAASILGVVAKMAFLVLPFLGYYLIGGEEVAPIWLGILICLVIGMVGMIKSDLFLAPIIGTRTTFVFTDTGLTVESTEGVSKWKLSELTSITAYEVPGDTATKHVVVVCPDGRKYDIFETWVTSKTSAAFDRVYQWYFQR